MISSRLARSSTPACDPMRGGRRCGLCSGIFHMVITAYLIPCQNFGIPLRGLVLYRGVRGSVSSYCFYPSKRFRLPPYYGQEEVFRGVEFQYANQSCELDLERASAKHVFLILPEHEKACPFEDSLTQAVSARTYSLIVARNSDHKLHNGYFAVGENGKVPAQDITVGVIDISTLEALKPDYPRAAVTPEANDSSTEEEAAKLYILDPEFDIAEWLTWFLACASVSAGALWSGSTRKLLLMTQHRRTKPKNERARSNGADLDPAPVAKAVGSFTTLDVNATSAQATTTAKPQSVKLPNAPSRARLRSSENILDEEMNFSVCPFDCNLLTLMALGVTVNLLMQYYFFNQMWYFLVGSITIGSVMSLIIIFDSLAFLIPCASMRMPNVVFPCFVRSMEVRHHIVIWCAVIIPLMWLVFRKANHAWVLQNLLGSSYAVNALRCVQLPNFKVITVISILLFFYDIFMVFATSFISKDVSVMESVAKGARDLPVIMRVPVFLSGDAIACGGYSMLGYGDIAVPGLAVAYCLSYDVIVKRGPWYFLLAIACYSAGLQLTFHVGRTWDSAQPALLYLVPAILLPIILLAWCRGDLKNFWNGEFVPKEGLLSARADVSSSEQFQMIQRKGLLYVSTPVVPWLAIPLPVSQKAYNAKLN